jgi:hypothetical protein
MARPRGWTVRRLTLTSFVSYARSSLGRTYTDSHPSRAKVLIGLNFVEGIGVI